MVITLMMASAQVVETSVNINNSPSQDYTTNPDNHSNHNIDSPGFKPLTVIRRKEIRNGRKNEKNDFGIMCFKKYIHILSACRY